MPRNRRTYFRGAGFAILAAALLCLSGCGYRVVGRANHLPATIHTIAVPVFENNTATYRIEQRLTEAVVHELLARTSYHVVAKPEAGDAVLYGTITGIGSSPIIFDSTTGRATTVLVTVSIAVRLQDRATGNILYRNDSLIFREPYEISTNIPEFFQEEGPALERLGRDFAARMVATLLENF